MTNNKAKYYYKKLDQFNKGIIGVDEWKRFCALYLYTDTQWKEVCKRLAKT
jgi:hypothetical protein